MCSLYGLRHRCSACTRNTVVCHRSKRSARHMFQPIAIWIILYDEKKKYNAQFNTHTAHSARAHPYETRTYFYFSHRFISQPPKAKTEANSSRCKRTQAPRIRHEIECRVITLYGTRMNHIGRVNKPLLNTIVIPTFWSELELFYGLILF